MDENELIEKYPGLREEFRLWYDETSRKFSGNMIDSHPEWLLHHYDAFTKGSNSFCFLVPAGDASHDVVVRVPDYILALRDMSMV